MVRKRPSRSTSARPIGRTSSSACRFDDCADATCCGRCRTAGRCQPRLRWRIGRDMDGAERLPAFAFGDEAHVLVLADLDEVREAQRQFGSSAALERALGKKTVRGDNFTLRVDNCGEDARAGESLASRALQSVGQHRSADLARGAFGKPPEQQVAARLRRARPRRCMVPELVSIAATQPAPSRQAIDLRELQAFSRLSFAARRRAAACLRNALDKPS